MDEVIAYLRKNRERHVEQMIELLKIPSISPGLPDPEAMQTAADWVERRLREIGVDEVRQLRVNGRSPVVWGRKQAGPDRPTILFYGHYDVMPPDPLEEWDSPPFEPELRNGDLYARGTADDKGQLLMHVNAVEAWLEANGSLPVNVLFAIEGEEEEGSGALEALLESDPDLFAADVAVISDSPFFARGCPSICYGLRGIAVAEIKVAGPGSDLHSGNFGGAVANPAEALARIIAGLKDEHGRITIPHFYDDVVELVAEERAAWASLPFDEAAMRADLGVPALPGERGFSPLERVWARPTFEVNGIGGGFQAAGSKTIIPSSAFAKISMRLVPDQGVEVTVERGHGGRPFLAPIDNDHVAAASRAMEKAFEGPVVLIRDGASIPIVPSIRETTGATCLLIGVDIPEGRIHAPNERLVLDYFHRGAETIALLIGELGG